MCTVWDEDFPYFVIYFVHFYLLQGGPLYLHKNPMRKVKLRDRSNEPQKGRKLTEDNQKNQQTK